MTAPALAPLQLAVIAAATVLSASVGLALLREPGPGERLRPPDEKGLSAGDRALRRLGGPAAALLLPRWTAYRDAVQRGLAYAGRPATETVEDFGRAHLGLVVASLVLVVGLGSGIGSVWFGLFVLAVAVVVPPARLTRDARRRQRVIEGEMPAFLELMAILLSSGLTFRHALTRVVARQRGPLAAELRTLLTQLELGWTPQDALDALVLRTSAPTVRRLVASARMNTVLGVPIADTLSLLAEDVRAEAAVDLKLRAQRAADRGALLLVFLVLPGVVGICIGILLSEAIDGLGPLL